MTEAFCVVKTRLPERCLTGRMGLIASLLKAADACIIEAKLLWVLA